MGKTEDGISFGGDNIPILLGTQIEKDGPVMKIGTKCIFIDSNNLCCLVKLPFLN